ncbi:MAG: general secretion pathway protein I [Alteromonadaceae bacterium]|jgi:general secretion pathway protein I
MVDLKRVTWFCRIKKVPTGFTLIEVMLAMAVFAIAGVALLTTADNHFRNMSHLESKMLTNWIASNQLVEATLDKTWPPKNNKKGKVELAGKEWFWLQKVTKTLDKNMRAVVIEVRATEQQKMATSSLMTYLAKSDS